MSENSTNFPPQTYSSSFYLNALAEDEKSLVVNADSLPAADGAETPILDCFISTMIEQLQVISLLLLVMQFPTYTPQKTPKECKADQSGKTRVFSSLTEYQSTRNSFDMDQFGYQGNIVSFASVPMDMLDKNSFVSFGSNSIIRLNLDRKHIRILDLGAFLGLDCLQYLDLSYNNISNVSEGVFEGLTNLQTLDMSSNLLETITDSGMAFNALQSLEVLNLSNNNITTIPRISFTSLFNLKTLNLSFNRLRHLDNTMFSPLVNLKQLCLNNNYLSAISPEKWANLGNLSDLNLAYNYIISFDTSYSFSFAHLKSLNLSHNYLSALNVDGIRNSLPELEILDVGGNKVGLCEDIEVLRHSLVDTSVVFVDKGCNEMKRELSAPIPGDIAPTISTKEVAVSGDSNLSLQYQEMLDRVLKVDKGVSHLENVVIFFAMVVIILLMMSIISGSAFCRRVLHRSRDGEYLDSAYGENINLLGR